jgi:bacterioferritin (cytochrome b1)
MASATHSLIGELNTLLRMTNTEIAIAETRRAQAGSEAIERELARNADKARERVQLIKSAIRDLGGLPDVVGVAAGRVGAFAKSQVEQGQDLSNALLGDLALEQQLHARARFLRVLAETSEHTRIVRVAERLERAHRETIDWLEIRLAEVALGGPAAIRPTPVQAVAGYARRIAALPLRGAASGLNHTLQTIDSLRSSAGELLDEQLERAEDLKEAAQHIYASGRDASLERAESEARDEGATRTAKAIRQTRGDVGALSADELAIAGYDELNATTAVRRINALDQAEDVRAILAYEERNAARTTVTNAAQARLGALARAALDDEAHSPSGASAARKERLAELTVEELRDKAANADIDGRSAMNKDDLVEALATI